MLEEFSSDPYWTVFGFVFQGAFFGRFLVQWIASERRRESIIPVAFWYLSIVGSLGLFIYAFFGKKDPVFAVGQSMGFIIYTRNLVLIRRRRVADQTAKPSAP